MECHHLGASIGTYCKLKRNHSLECYCDLSAHYPVFRSRLKLRPPIENSTAEQTPSQTEPFYPFLHFILFDSSVDY